MEIGKTDSKVHRSTVLIFIKLQNFHMVSMNRINFGSIFPSNFLKCGIKMLQEKKCIVHFQQHIWEEDQEERVPFLLVNIFFAIKPCSSWKDSILQTLNFKSERKSSGKCFSFYLNLKSHNKRGKHVRK